MRLWDWAVAAYAAPGVGEACLALQDSHEQNVPVLLWSGWVAATGADPARRRPSDLSPAWL